MKDSSSTLRVVFSSAGYDSESRATIKFPQRIIAIDYRISLPKCLFKIGQQIVGRFDSSCHSNHSRHDALFI